jgi:hypothetical protein
MSPIVGWLVRNPEPELAVGGAEDEVPAPTEGGGKTSGVRARSLAGGCGVGSLLPRGGTHGSEIVPKAVPATAPLENLMAALRQENNKKKNKKSVMLLQRCENGGKEKESNKLKEENSPSRLRHLLL